MASNQQRQSGIKWATETRVVSVSVCPPGVRMVLVECWATSEEGEWEVEHQLYPAVVIQARIVETWSLPYTGEKEPKLKGTTKELVEAGWRLEHRREEVEPLAMSPDGYLADKRDWELTANAACEWVACPWPQEEDEERLKKVIEQMGERALVKAKASEERQTRKAMDSAQAQADRASG